MSIHCVQVQSSVNYIGLGRNKEGVVGSSYRKGTSLKAEVNVALSVLASHRYLAILRAFPRDSWLRQHIATLKYICLLMVEFLYSFRVENDEKILCAY